MCGITGFVDFTNKSNISVLKKMTSALVHRGPDNLDYFFKKKDFGILGLGHTRLSIIDLSSAGAQPMSFDGVTITYNGEIYNYLEIKRELIKNNYNFTTDTDTEVLLKAYHFWGDEFVNLLIGMFSIAIYDSKTNNIKLIRDRLGVKPLYWMLNNGLFLFASEIKSFFNHESFRKEIDFNQAFNYFSKGYIDGDGSIFTNVKKLLPGSILTLNLVSKKLTIHNYWKVNDFFSKKEKISDLNQAIEECENLLISACNYRMISDVPLGVFLSGGYDSSLVAAILSRNSMEKIHTFTIGFQEHEFNEANHAAKVANYLGTDHKELYCSNEDVIEMIDLLPKVWDEPFGDTSAIPTLLLSRFAKKHITVALSADGGDEIFAGYNKYLQFRKKINFIKRVPSFSYRFLTYLLGNRFSLACIEKTSSKLVRERVARVAASLGKTMNESFIISSQIFSNDQLEIFFKGLQKIDPSLINTHDHSWLQVAQVQDINSYLPENILTKVDRATMAFGLEGREPLLDHRIVEFAGKLDDALKINKGVGKFLLREIAHQYIPRELIEKPKKGFTPPISHWMRGILKEQILDYLSEQKLKESEFFHSGNIIKLRDNFLNRKNDNYMQLWLIFNFEMWKTHHLDY